MAERKYSSIIDREEPTPGKPGRRPYNREQIYRWLYTNSDHRGIVVFSQQDISKKLEIGYQNLSTIFTDFVTTGHLKKYGRNYEVVFDPDDLDWGEKFRSVHAEIRKVHQHPPKGDKTNE